MNDVAISLSQVCLRYQRGFGLGRKASGWVLQDVSFDLYHGEALGVIGRNGAGKSSLLKLLGKMIEPDQGVIRFNVDRVSLLALHVGFQQHLTGRENALISSMFMGVPRKEAESMLDSIAEFAGIGAAMEEEVGAYSSGMLARLGFAVANHVNADVILVDEVIAVGDAEFGQRARMAMRDKIRQGGTAVIVSHDLALLEQWCSRVIWLDQGRIRMSGESADVISCYQEALGVKQK